MTVSIRPKGSDFTRMVIAKGLAGEDENASAVAAARWGEGSTPARLLKAAAPGGATGGWGEELVSEAGAAAREFMSLVRAETIIGKLAGLRRVPLHTPYLGITGGVTAAWVPEGAAMPMGVMSFARNSLPALKVAGGLVVTKELLESGDPAAEETIRADLVRAVSEASDLAFIDPTNSGVAGEQPASITDGITPVAASSDFKADLVSLCRNFQGDLTRAFLVGRPELFVSLSGIDYPNVGARGGEIAGIPAIASRGVPMAVGDTYQLALIDPTGIVYASDPAGTEVKTAKHGSIQMDTEPNMAGAPDPTGAATVSMWQTNSVGIAALVWENWAIGRAGSVSILTGIAAEPDS